MKWSTGFILLGLIVIALGLPPLVFHQFTSTALATSASFITVGLLIFLGGLGMRRIRKAFDEPAQAKAKSK